MGRDRPPDGQAIAAGYAREGAQVVILDINADAAAAQVASPLLRERARNQLREIETVSTRHAVRYAVVPLLSEEPVGVQRLLQLAGEAPPSSGV